MKYLLLLSLFIQTAIAQTYVSDIGRTHVKFQGTEIKDAYHYKGAISVREVSGKQAVLLVLEVKDFKMDDRYLQDELKDEYLEAMYFPQIRVTGELKEKIDLTKDGIYPVTFVGRFTMRQIPKPAEFKMNLEIKNQEMTVNFEKEIDLREYNVPYAGEGSVIGKMAKFIFSGTLKRTF